MSRYSVEPHHFEFAEPSGALCSGELAGDVDTADIDDNTRTWLESYAVQLGLARPVEENEASGSSTDSSGSAISG